MKENLLTIVGAAAIFLGIFGLITGLAVGLSIANANWNCSQWHKNTGEQTKVMASKCFVKNGTKWEIFDTHIKTSHLDLNEPAK